MKRMNLPTPQFLEPAKRPDDRADECLGKSERLSDKSMKYDSRATGQIKNVECAARCMTTRLAQTHFHFASQSITCQSRTIEE